MLICNPCLWNCYSVSYQCDLFTNVLDFVKGGIENMFTSTMSYNLMVSEINQIYCFSQNLHTKKAVLYVIKLILIRQLVWNGL